MLELSPLLTAANACASSIPASRNVSRSKPMPVTRRPANPAPSRRKADSFESITATVCPWPSRISARVDPTRPQPMMTKCTLGPLRSLAVPADASAVRRSGRARPGPGRQALASGDVPQITDAFKRVLLGRAMRSDRLHETLLPKRVALPVFASDALSSVAYAPDEVFLTLGIAGITAYSYSWKVGVAVALVMLVVVASYRQNVHAYPSGGGDYEVATVNLGPTPGLTVASALLVDYVLTVAVSISSAAQYAASTVDAFQGHEVTIAVVAVVLLMSANLRGVRESGTAFAVPTYAFMVAILGMAAYAFLKLAFGNLGQVESAHFTLVAEDPYSSGIAGIAGAFLLLRAFSSGCAALTGVEAISNGVPAFRKPKSKNAATTLLLLGVIAVSMMLSIIVLAKKMGIRYAENPAEQLELDGHKGVPSNGGVQFGHYHYDQDPVIGQIAKAVFHNAAFFAGIVTTVTGL